MQTCSNCGSVSRDGAKFCTTCGSRLNQIVDNDQNAGWVSFPTPEPEPTPDPHPTPDLEPTPDPQPTPYPEPADATQVSPAVSYESPINRESKSPTAEPEAVGPWGDVAGGPTDEELVDEATSEASNASAFEPDQAEDESLSSWANQWSMSDDNDEDADSSASEPTSDDRVAVAGNAVDYIAAQEIDTDVDADTDPVAETGLFPSRDDDTIHPKERAQALIFELRELIDEAFATPDPVSNIDAGSGGNGDALATLNSLPGDDGSFDSLRTILEKAREQPRDVDTMLNLLGEINSLIALVDSHQRYVDAVETAKQQLS